MDQCQQSYLRNWWQTLHARWFEYSMHTWRMRSLGQHGVHNVIAAIYTAVCVATHAAIHEAVHSAACYHIHISFFRIYKGPTSSYHCWSSMLCIPRDTHYLGHWSIHLSDDGDTYHWLPVNLYHRFIRDIERNENLSYVSFMRYLYFYQI